MPLVYISFFFFFLKKNSPNFLKTRIHFYFNISRPSQQDRPKPKYEAHTSVTCKLNHLSFHPPPPPPTHTLTKKNSFPPTFLFLYTVFKSLSLSLSAISLKIQSRYAIFLNLITPNFYKISFMNSDID
jgi:hypothetical protein